MARRKKLPIKNTNKPTDDNVIKNIYTHMTEEELYKEMLLNKKIDNINKSVKGVDERIYKDLSTNRPSGNTSTNSESIISRKIIQYREMSRNPELEDIIRDIVNEAVVSNGMDEYPVKLYISEDSGIVKQINAKAIEKIYKKFTDMMEKFAFDIEGSDIFERWYVDGRMYIWMKRDSSGAISSYEILDPILLSLKVDPDKNASPVYVYNNAQQIPILGEGTNWGAGAFNQGILGKSSYSGLSGSEKENAVEIDYDDVVVVFSGVFDHLLKIYISPLEKALKILNQLNNMEDAMVMYQFIRAVPRRVFKIDTGNLPPKDREAHLNTVQKRHRETLNLKYNTETGAIEGDEKVRFMSMFDDYWIATFEGDKTDISPLDSPTSEWDTITEKLNYFRQKLYRAMNVPFSRYSAQANAGQEEYKITSDTLSRYEVKFIKYINALRKRFSDVFYQILEKEVLEEKILSSVEWNMLKKRVTIEWEDDNYFSKLRNFEIMKKESEVITSLDSLVGKYYTRDYIYREVLGRNDEDMKNFENQIEKETEKYGAEGEQGMGGESSGDMGMGGEASSPGVDFSQMSFNEPAGGEAPAPEGGAPELTPEAPAPETPASMAGQI